MDKLVHTWETNEQLTLSQREKYRFLEEGYLREKHSKKEKTYNFEIKKENNFYIMIENTIYKIDSEDENNYYVSRSKETLTVVKTTVNKKEGSKIWKLF